MWTSSVFSSLSSFMLCRTPPILPFYGRPPKDRTAHRLDVETAQSSLCLSILGTEPPNNSELGERNRSNNLRDPFEASRT